MKFSLSSASEKNEAVEYMLSSNLNLRSTGTGIFERFVNDFDVVCACKSMLFLVVSKFAGTMVFLYF